MNRRSYLSKQKIQITLGLAVCIFCLGEVKAQVKQYQFKRDRNVTVEKWEVSDIVFQTKSKVTSPFTSDFTAVFMHESGEKQLVPGFYNGDNNWIIRFSASLEGSWSYITNSSISGLNGKKGKVKVIPNKGNNHGAVVVNKNDPQRFYYEDGTPYFLLAFECDWLYALDYDNEKSIPKTDHFLSLLSKNGINQIVMNVYSYDVSWKKDPKLKNHPEHEMGGSQTMFPFLGSNKKPDFSSLNPLFFQKLDRTINSMHDKRIASHLMIYVWNKLVSWPEMNSKADNMYFEYVVKRYQAFPNIVWDVSKEALFHGRADEAYIKNRLELIRATDEYDRLVSVHDYGYCSRHPDEVDFISTQDWSHNIYDKMLTAKEKYIDKPIFNIEHGGYEESPYVTFTGDYVNAETCLRRNYLCAFAGAYSTYYWQGAAWNVLIYNPFQQPEEFIKPRFVYYKHMTAFFGKYDLTTFSPAPEKSSSGYALSNDENDYLVYLPKENIGVSYYNFWKDRETRTVQWFNTLTGEYTEVTPLQREQPYVSPWQGEADVIFISNNTPAK